MKKNKLRGDLNWNLEPRAWKNALGEVVFLGRRVRLFRTDQGEGFFPLPRTKKHNRIHQIHSIWVFFRE
jgi:hypothetical protein